MKMQIKLAALALLVATFDLLPSTLFAQGTAFTYQGRLNDGTNVANGRYDMSFALFDAATVGLQVSPIVTATNIGVTNGLFIVVVDFGPGVFLAANRWLQISVRTNGNGGFTALTSRQQLTPTPYAVTAENLIAGGLAGTYTNAVALSNTNNTLVGNGAGLAGVNAATLGGLGANQFWTTAGNGGTTPGTNYLGTTDNQALEMKVNGARALRLEPNSAIAPNVIGGAPFNAVGPGFVGSTIGGGGAANYFGVFSYTNEIDADFGVIGGGIDNHIQTYAQYSAIGGGQGNLIQTNSNYSVVGGGYLNYITTNSLFSFVGGGVGNGIQDNASSSTISGGEGNTIQSQADHSMIGGGYHNNIQLSSSDSTIDGGYGNTIQSNAYFSVLGGGQNNSIQVSADHSVLGGGNNNSIQPYAYRSFVGGGEMNSIQPNSDHSVLGGGQGNTIQFNAWNSVLGGGLNNSIRAGGYFSFLGGGQNNSIQTNAYFSFLGGGFNNSIQTNSDHSVLGGGNVNSIQAGAAGSVLVGGSGNAIQPNATFSVLVGGNNNSIFTSADHSVLAGGDGNNIRANASFSVLGGGYGNSVAGQFATVPGGYFNYAGGNYSFAAGQNANALHTGSFVWADSQVGTFTDSGLNQFLIRAAGGVGVGVTSPTAALDVAGSTRSRDVFRNGSESGTSELPNPAGLVMRRINSTSMAYGQVVAKTDTATLIRDGSAGGMLLVVPANNTGKLTIGWMGIDNSGIPRGGNSSIDTAIVVSGFTTTVFDDTAHIVHAQITFGRTYDAGQQLTQVVIDRYDDKASIHDYYWSGTIISTYNQ